MVVYCNTDGEPIRETFKQFCKERHLEDKGRNHDLLQEVYAETEFFDFSLLDPPIPNKESLNFTKNGNNISAEIKAFSLPFKTCFIRISPLEHLFIREYSPEIITGTLRDIEDVYYSNGTSQLVIYNFPFTIRLNGEFAQITCSNPPEWCSGENVEEIKRKKIENFLKGIPEEENTRIFTGFCIDVVNEVGELFEKLSKQAVASDLPPVIKYDYYRRKKAPTIKVAQRPIYYLLGNKTSKAKVKYAYNSIKSEGKLEYSYAFRVRGHWRRIGDKSFGKDRSGVYGVKGFTWVVDHIRGEGELSKRLRVIKYPCTEEHAPV